VWVDLGQLLEYRQRPLGHQPFYVFPWPDWHGNLTVAASAGGRSVTQMGFRRSGPRWRFADWMVLLTAAQVSMDLSGYGERSMLCLLLRNSVDAVDLAVGSLAG
jgi:hypothetical protein